ncbi:MAG TPA: outer membrane beta-barrel protein [Terriglobia bacterium]|nr:outer membrane beta-barrel protein [Terriglobia bacterium]
MTYLKSVTSSLLLAGFLVCHAASAAAQDSHRFEVFGSLGSSTSAELFTPSSTSPNIGVGFGFRPFSSNHGIAHRIGLEVEVDTASEKHFTGGLFTPALSAGYRRQTFALGDVLFHFGGGRVEPYVLAAFGNASSPRNSAAGGLGGGAKIFVRKHVYLRPEFRATVTRRDDFSARGSLALGYHW